MIPPYKRHLIIIPIVHTRADFRSPASRVTVAPEYETTTTRYWQAVSEYIQMLPVDFSELRVYQDGLPDIPTNRVAERVDKGRTANYELLRWLRGKGAHIMGTENQPLVAQEYCALQAIYNAKDEEQRQTARREYAQVSASLLEGRDEYIAGRIKATLPEGGMGILFIGLEHEVHRWLGQEIEVSEPETLIGASSEALRKRLLYGKEREL